MVRVLLDRRGRTYAEEAGIRSPTGPGPLYQLLVLATLLSTRIRAGVAVDAARELFAAGYRTPQAMEAATLAGPGRRAGPGPLPPLRRADRHHARHRRPAVPGPLAR